MRILTTPTTLLIVGATAGVLRDALRASTAESAEPVTMQSLGARTARTLRAQGHPCEHLHTEVALPVSTLAAVAGGQA